jgi:hypothetical protein
MCQGSTCIASVEGKHMLKAVVSFQAMSIMYHVFDSNIIASGHNPLICPVCFSCASRLTSCTLSLPCVTAGGTLKKPP